MSSITMKTAYTAKRSGTIPPWTQARANAAPQKNSDLKSVLLDESITKTTSRNASSEKRCGLAL